MNDKEATKRIIRFLKQTIATHQAFRQDLKVLVQNGEELGDDLAEGVKSGEASTLQVKILRHHLRMVQGLSLLDQQIESSLQSIELLTTTIEELSRHV